jgi:hypothetical protein
MEVDDGELHSDLFSEVFVSLKQSLFMAGTYSRKQLMHIPQTCQKSKAADLLLHCMFQS